VPFLGIDENRRLDADGGGFDKVTADMETIECILVLIAPYFPWLK